MTPAKTAGSSDLVATSWSGSVARRRWRAASLRQPAEPGSETIEQHQTQCSRCAPSASRIPIWRLHLEKIIRGPLK
jgi:hypothetical protein